MGSEMCIRDRRWTVDEQVDLETILQIFENLYLEKHNLSMHDMLELVQCASSNMPDNSYIWRNEGYAESVDCERSTLN